MTRSLCEHAATASMIALLLVIACLLPCAAGCVGGAPQREAGTATAEERERSRAFLTGRDAPVYTYEVVDVRDHDIRDYTQGMYLDGDVMYEGTGLNGQSRLIKADFRTGEVLAVHELEPLYFGEGVTVLSDEVFQLTYTTNLGFVYDKESLELKRSFSYPTQGWGLTHDGESLIMSDGTSTLYYLDPESGAETGRVTVSDNLGPVSNLNELEYVQGEIYANIWKSDVIAVISPGSGEVAAWVDLAGINPDPAQLTGDYVLNGIAYDARTGHLLVTGKFWPYL